MKKLFVLLVVLFVSSTLLAMPFPGPTEVFFEDFNDGTFSKYWDTFGNKYGEWSVTGAAGQGAHDDHPFLPAGFFAAYPGEGMEVEDTYGILSVYLGGAYIEFDFLLLMQDLGYAPKELADMSISYDVAQTALAADPWSWFPIDARFVYGWDMGPRGSRMTPGGADYTDDRGEAFDPNSGTWGAFANSTAISSQGGGAPHEDEWETDGFSGPLGDAEPYHRLNRGEWEWQRLRHEWDTTQYHTMTLYQDYNMDGEFVCVATSENLHPSHFDEAKGYYAWPYPEAYSLYLPYADTNGISWYFDNFTITLNNPYLDWNLVTEDSFDDGVIDAKWTTSGYWTVLGGDDNDPSAPLGARTGKMASSEPDAYFKASIPATIPGELVAVTFTIEQSNGSEGHYPIFFGLVDAESDDYYVQYASPNSQAYGDVSGAMTMLSFTEGGGDGTNPFKPELIDGEENPDITDEWWNFGAGEEGISIAAEGTTRVDMIINPWDNHPYGSINVYFDRELVAKWSNFRGIYSFNEVFFGMRNNYLAEFEGEEGEEGYAAYVPTWNFDRVAVYTRQARCGDAGYLPGDLNQDCVVDFNDLALFATEWLDSANFPDFASLAADWFECTDPSDLTCF